MPAQHSFFLVQMGAVALHQPLQPLSAPKQVDEQHLGADIYELLIPALLHLMEEYGHLSAPRLMVKKTVGSLFFNGDDV